ncbi:hypothetical protein D3C86_1725760 [compost metagenome]
MIVKAETAQHHVRCCQLDELRRGQFGKNVGNFLADAKPEHGFHLVFAHQSLREQKIGEIDLPDLLENFTAFQFFPATKTLRPLVRRLPASCPWGHWPATRSFSACSMGTTYYERTSPGYTFSLKRYICYRV